MRFTKAFNELEMDEKSLFDSLKVFIWLKEIFITLSTNPINWLSISKWLQLDSCPSEGFSENPRVLYKVENYYQIATGKKNLLDPDKSRGLGKKNALSWKVTTNQSSACIALFKIIIYQWKKKSLRENPFFGSWNATISWAGDCLVCFLLTPSRSWKKLMWLCISGKYFKMPYQWDS